MRRAFVSLSDLRLTEAICDVETAQRFAVELRLYALSGADISESLLAWHYVLTYRAEGDKSSA